MAEAVSFAQLRRPKKAKENKFKLKLKAAVPAAPASPHGQIQSDKYLAS